MPRAMTRGEVEAWLEAHGFEDVLLADGFDAAFIGVISRCGQSTIAIYDHEKCVASLAAEGCSYEDAVEFMDFNVTGAWVGEGTPGFLVKVEPNDKDKQEL